MIPTTIAIVADCDDTLAPDTTAQLLDRLDVDKQDFYINRVGNKVRAGWDPSLAYLLELLQLLSEKRITGDRIAALRVNMSETVDPWVISEQGEIG
jgi:hypothetical protein